MSYDTEFDLEIPIEIRDRGVKGNANQFELDKLNHFEKQLEEKDNVIQGLEDELSKLQEFMKKFEEL